MHIFGLEEKKKTKCLKHRENMDILHIGHIWDFNPKLQRFEASVLPTKPPIYVSIWLASKENHLKSHLNQMKMNWTLWCSPEDTTVICIRIAPKTLNLRTIMLYCGDGMLPQFDEHSWCVISRLKCGLIITDILFPQVC